MDQEMQREKRILILMSNSPHITLSPKHVYVLCVHVT